MAQLATQVTYTNTFSPGDDVPPSSDVSPKSRIPILATSNGTLQLDPDKNGVSNVDIDWLARGSSLQEKGMNQIINF
jgi:hypothetical protein